MLGTYSASSSVRLEAHGFRSNFEMNSNVHVLRTLLKFLVKYKMLGHFYKDDLEFYSRFISEGIYIVHCNTTMLLKSQHQIHFSQVHKAKAILLHCSTRTAFSSSDLEKVPVTLAK